MPSRLAQPYHRLMDRGNESRIDSISSFDERGRLRVQRARQDRIARPVTNPFDLGLLPGDGTRCSERSFRLAHELALMVGVGADSPVVIDYLGAVSVAPAEHLEILRERDGRLVFAPTVGAALTSSVLSTRRSQPMTLRQCQELENEYSHEAGVAAAYDCETDALIFPTAYRARDLEYPVLHELGHALTMPRDRESPCEALLRDLPLHIRRHLRPYRMAGAGFEELAWEVLAEAYVLLLVGRAAELPAPVLSELFAMLTL
jgi:hypothetical protein